jgi:hypothetical protein
MKAARFDFLAVFSAQNIVFAAMLAVGALCIFMSASNTTSYLVLTGMNDMIAAMTGIALVIFSSTSATAAQLFIIQKGWGKIFAVPFIIVGAVVIVFSIFSTLSLNYNKFINSEAIVLDMREKIEKKRSELLSRQKTEDGNPNQWAIESMNRLLDLSERTGESWSNSMQRVLDMSASMSEEGQRAAEHLYVETLPRTFFGFMLELKTLDKKYFFDFFMIAIPAIFYDLIAPLAMTVVLFLMGFKTKNGPESEKEAQKPEHENQPDIKDINEYIENAMQKDYSLLDDGAVPDMEARRCAELREYLMQFRYKGSPVISGSGGRYISIFDKDNLKRFIALQYNVQRIR